MTSLLEGIITAGDGLIDELGHLLGKGDADLGPLSTVADIITSQSASMVVRFAYLSQTRRKVAHVSQPRKGSRGELGAGQAHP